MVAESVGAEEEEEGELKKAGKEPTAQQVATVPYLLFLAQGGVHSRSFCEGLAHLEKFPFAILAQCHVTFLNGLLLRNMYTGHRVRICRL